MVKQYLLIQITKCRKGKCTLMKGGVNTSTQTSLQFIKTHDPKNLFISNDKKTIKHLLQKNNTRQLRNKLVNIAGINYDVYIITNLPPFTEKYKKLQKERGHTAYSPTTANDNITNNIERLITIKNDNNLDKLNRRINADLKARTIHPVAVVPVPGLPVAGVPVPVPGLPVAGLPVAGVPVPGPPVPGPPVPGGGRRRKSKITRKHKAIYQSGGNKGKLKKGYKYTGKKTKTGLPIIAKSKKN